MKTHTELIADIHPSDHAYSRTAEGKCSRCRQQIKKDEYPLVLWNKDRESVWVFCDNCTPEVIHKS